MAFKIVLSEMSTVVIVSLNSLSGKAGIGSAPSDSKTLAKKLFNSPVFFQISGNFDSTRDLEKISFSGVSSWCENS